MYGYLNFIFGNNRIADSVEMLEQNRHEACAMRTTVRVRLCGAYNSVFFSHVTVFLTELGAIT
jgi:hypothetical protein